jgi:hypothetical protein
MFLNFVRTSSFLRKTPLNCTVNYESVSARIFKNVIALAEAFRQEHILMTTIRKLEFIILDWAHERIMALNGKVIQLKWYLRYVEQFLTETLECPFK